VRGKPFEYRFVVETVAHDGRAIEAGEFDGLAAKTDWFRILGIYDPGRYDV
jgi:prephenate dehydratase